MTVLEGLMQHDFPLTLHHVLNRMRTLNAGAEVVTLRGADGRRSRATYAEVASRVDQLAGALKARGIQEGDRIGTFAWNTQEHV
ncbi:long-chain fatty acid--CoA ligase, partial [Mycobacterium sp. ITM-2017-0098]